MATTAPANPTTATPFPPQPVTPRMTAEEFGLKHAGDRVEYIDGVVKEVPMAGGKHGKICYRVSEAFTRFFGTSELGHVFINDTFVKVPTKDDPTRVYGPDVCFVSYDRLPRDAEIPDGVIPVTPNLVFEVRSPTDTWTNVFEKVVDYLKAGVPVVVTIDPNTRTASVCGEPFGQRMLNPGDTLTIPEVLPGFEVPLAALFV